MAIFNSCVELPEGNNYVSRPCSDLLQIDPALQTAQTRHLALRSENAKMVIPLVVIDPQNDNLVPPILDTCQGFLWVCVCVYTIHREIVYIC